MDGYGGGGSLSLSLYDYELDPPKGDVGRKEEQIRRRANGATHFRQPFEITAIVWDLR